MRHLFLAPLGSAFGEALHGLRIARQLVAVGHEVVFLAPARMHGLLDDAPVLFGRIDLALPHLDQALPPLIRRQRCDTLVLVDVAAVGKAVRALRLDVLAFTRPGIPVIALDCWNLPARQVTWDYGPTSETLDAELHGIERKLVAVPIAPLAAPGGFAAMPSIAPVDAAERARVRAELGLRVSDRLIVWPTATWQHAEHQEDATLGRLAAALPALVVPALAQLGADVHVVHVGPLPFPGAAAITPRYRFLSQVAPARFERLVASADLLLSFNAVGTSLATSMAARVPVLLGAPVSDGTTLRAWPLSLDRFLAPTLADNPFYAAMRLVDPLDQSAFLDACRSLLFDAAAADQLRQRQDDYHRQVTRLPLGHERLLSLLGESR